ncbi:NfeD family protein, partial [Streptomyces violaceoruber]
MIVSAVLVLAEIFTLTAALGMLGVAALITAGSA